MNYFHNCAPIAAPWVAFGKTPSAAACQDKCKVTPRCSGVGRRWVPVLDVAGVGLRRRHDLRRAHRRFLPTGEGDRPHLRPEPVCEHDRQRLPLPKPLKPGPPPPPPPPPPGCPQNCNLNGVCGAGTRGLHECLCNPAWEGDDCGRLALLLSPPRPRARRAVHKLLVVGRRGALPSTPRASTICSWPSS